MKVTALISDELIQQVMTISGGKNITESITIALKEYTSQKKIDNLIDQVVNEPLEMYSSSTSIRTLNRAR